MAPYINGGFFFFMLYLTDIKQMSTNMAPYIDGGFFSCYILLIPNKCQLLAKVSRVSVKRVLKICEYLKKHVKLRAAVAISWLILMPCLISLKNLRKMCMLFFKNLLIILI